MKSDLVDVTLYLHAETEKAILASTDGNRAKAVWLPKSQIEMEEVKVNSVVTKSWVVTMREALAIDKGLV